MVDAAPSVSDAEGSKRTKPAAWFADTRAAIAAWMMVSCFVVIVLCWWKPPAADNQLLNTLLGIYFTGGFATAIGWWMGSSKGSEDKSADIVRQLEKK